MLQKMFEISRQAQWMAWDEGVPQEGPDGKPTHMTVEEQRRFYPKAISKLYGVSLEEAASAYSQRVAK